MGGSFRGVGDYGEIFKAAEKFRRVIFAVGIIPSGREGIVALEISVCVWGWWRYFIAINV